MKIEIEAEFGSSFQEEVHKQSLILLLKAWQQFMLSRHKKNKAQILINKDNIIDLDL